MQPLYVVTHDLLPQACESLILFYFCGGILFIDAQEVLVRVVDSLLLDLDNAMQICKAILKQIDVGISELALHNVEIMN